MIEITCKKSNMSIELINALSAKPTGEGSAMAKTRHEKIPHDKTRHDNIPLILQLCYGSGLGVGLALRSEKSYK